MAAAAPDLPGAVVTSGAPYWYWLGGRPALDFVNTLRERWNRRVECLTGPEDLSRWLARAALVEGAAPPAGPELLDRARELREAIDLGVQAAVGGATPPSAAVETIDGWLGYAGGRPALVLADGRASLVERSHAGGLERALGLVALDAARVLGADAERARLRICASDTCSARFYDRSAAAGRRWCSMQACGNVAKARRHRERATA